MKLKLNIHEVVLAYDAVTNTPQLQPVADPILTMLDVEDYKDEYELEFSNAEFENIRIAVSQHSSTSPNERTQIELLALLERLNEIRPTLV